MITIFNRKELTVTFSMKRQSEIRDILKKSNVDYIVKVVNTTSPSAFSAGSRARTGTYGQNLEVSYEYIFYVKKQDFEKAQYLIR